METNLGVVGLRHLQHIVGIGQEDVATLVVDCHILMLAAFELFQRLGVVAFDPAGLVERNRLPAALCAIFVEQAVLDDLELQLSDCTDNLAAVETVGEQLGHALVHQLADTLFELLGLHGVGVLDVFEHFGRETGQAFEMDFLAGGDCVADLEVAGVGNTHDVAGPGLVDDALFLGHESRGRREFQGFSGADVAVDGIALEFAGADLHESDAGTVVGVHVGMNLEHEAGEAFLVGPHGALDCLDGPGRGGDFHEAVQQFLDAEGIQGRAEEHRSDAGVEIILNVEFRVYAFDKFQVFAQLGGIGRADGLVDTRVADVVDFHTLRNLLFVGGEEVEAVFVDIVDALEPGADIDGPTEGTDADFQFGFQFVEDVEGVAALAVEFVDENNHGGVAHTAHFHEFAGLLLDALGHVDHDDYGIDGRKGAVGVLGEILVARGIENVNLVVAVVETHHGRSHRNTALFFDFHPVAGGGFLDFVAFDGTGDMDSAAIEQEFLGEGGFAGVGVRDDGEGAPAADFVA